jgi:hypothetical protein
MLKDGGFSFALGLMCVAFQNFLNSLSWLGIFTIIAAAALYVYYQYTKHGGE